MLGQPLDFLGIFQGASFQFSKLLLLELNTLLATLHFKGELRKLFAQLFKLILEIKDGGIVLVINTFLLLDLLMLLLTILANHLQLVLTLLQYGSQSPGAGIEQIFCEFTHAFP